ncbi:MAG: substrate-binding domain-containing protein [Flavobacteriales bacterium]|nr:substrate-binding domain-containing protein [Flavobacteriales bacterium]
MKPRTLPSVALFGAACALLLAGCEFTAPDPYNDDTPTSGKVIVLADVDSRPVIEQEAVIFHSFYPKAEIEVRYMTEGELLKAMMNDSVRCVVSSVAYGPDQQADFRERKLSALPVVPIYTDAIAVVVNKASPIARLDLQQIKAILISDTTAVRVTTDMENSSTIHPLRAVFAKQWQRSGTDADRFFTLAGYPRWSLAGCGDRGRTGLQGRSGHRFHPLRGHQRSGQCGHANPAGPGETASCRICVGLRCHSPQPKHHRGRPIPAPTDHEHAVDRGEKRSWHWFCFLCRQP